MRIAELPAQEGALLEAEERAARVGAVEHVLTLLVVPQVAALNTRRLVAVERALVETEALNGRLHYLQDDVAGSKLGQFVQVVGSKVRKVSEFGQVVGGFGDGGRDVVRDVALVAVFVVLAAAGLVAFLLQSNTKK